MAGKAQAAKRNIGGGTWYAGGNSNVAKEAKERKDGGPVKKNKGGAVKRAYGGRTVGSPKGAPVAAPRLDKRARGGGIQKFSSGGADRTPYSSAASSGDKAIRTTIHGTALSVAKHASGGSVKKK